MGGPDSERARNRRRDDGEAQVASAEQRSQEAPFRKESQVISVSLRIARQCNLLEDLMEVGAVEPSPVRRPKHGWKNLQ